MNETTTMPAHHQPNAAMKRIATAALAVLLLASSGHSKPNSSAPQQKIVLLSRISSECLLGDECPETRSEKDEFGQLKGEPQVLPALLALGWRVVSFTPVNSEQGYSDHSVAFPASYVLLEK